MANIKLGNTTLSGVDKIKVQDADTAGSYVEFSEGGGGGGTNGFTITFGGNGDYSRVNSLAVFDTAGTRTSVTLDGTQRIYNNIIGVDFYMGSDGGCRSVTGKYSMVTYMSSASRYYIDGIRTDIDPMDGAKMLILYSDLTLDNWYNDH